MPATLNPKAKTLTIQIDNDIVSNDDIWGWYMGGITPEQIDRYLNQYKGQYDTVIPEINSNGGVVTAGMAIANKFKMLATQGIKIEPVISGVAASIASIIALSGTSKPKMFTGSYIMIHNPKTMTFGDDEDLINVASTVKTMKDDIVDIYTSYTGKSREETLTAMKNETWYGLKQAVEIGFSEPLPPIAGIYNSTVVYNKTPFSSCFKNAPEQVKDVMVHAEYSMPTQERTTTMSKLTDLLASDPEAKKEHDAIIAQAKSESDHTGEQNQETEQGSTTDDQVKANLTRAKAIINSDKYAKSIKMLATDVLTGEQSIIALNAAVAAYDATVEAKNSLEAQNITHETGETQPVTHSTVNNAKPGNMKTAADVEAYIAKMKKTMA